MKTISLTPEALAALNAEGDEPIKAAPVLPPKMRRLLHEHVAKAAYGPLMKPPFKTQLMYHSSFGATLASRASDKFMQRAWKYMRARMSA